MLHRPHRLLLVDDDREVRHGVEELLSGLGLEFRHAENGLEALDLVRAEEIHAALLDMHMPGFTGIEALPLLIQTERREPAAASCTRAAGRPDARRGGARRAGALKACLKKPVEPETLRREIRRALPGAAAGRAGLTRPASN